MLHFLLIFCILMTKAIEQQLIQVQNFVSLFRDSVLSNKLVLLKILKCQQMFCSQKIIVPVFLCKLVCKQTNCNYCAVPVLEIHPNMPAWLPGNYWSYIDLTVSVFLSY